MAAVDSLSFDGSGPNVCQSAAAFALDRVPRLSLSDTFRQGDWEVECSSMTQYIVARSRLALSRDDLIKQAFEVVQIALDVWAVRGLETLRLVNTGSECILLFLDKKIRVLQIVTADMETLYVSMTLSLGPRPADAGPVPPPSKHLISNQVPSDGWVSSFRFYRLAETSGDVFDAYRNMYLAFENLLDGICPKKRKRRSKLG